MWCRQCIQNGLEHVWFEMHLKCLTWSFTNCQVGDERLMSKRRRRPEVPINGPMDRLVTSTAPYSAILIAKRHPSDSKPNLCSSQKLQR